MGVPAQLPPAHRSSLVQAWRSSQGLLLLTWRQPVARSQESSVHPLPSSQLMGAPAHSPSAQTSWSVQASPSLHMTLLFVCVQTPDVQASVVHPFPSSH